MLARYTERCIEVRPLSVQQMGACQKHSFLTRSALPLGELSPQVTERVLQPFSNDKINLCAHTTKIPVDIPVGES